MSGRYNSMVSDKKADWTVLSVGMNIISLALVVSAIVIASLALARVKDTEKRVATTEGLVTQDVTATGTPTFAGVTTSSFNAGTADTVATGGTIAISPTTAITYIDTTAGVEAGLTLAVGAANQVKILTMTVDNGDATLTNANGNLAASVPTSIVFSAVGDTVTLVSNGATWAVAGIQGATAT